MTATMTPQETATSTPPGRSRPRAGRGLVALALILGVVTLAVTLRPGAPMSPAGPELDAAAFGTYRLPDGELLTLFGTVRAPHYERGGRVTMLMVDDADVLTSMMGDETLSVVRDGAGAVAGVRLEGSGDPPVFAAPVLVHTEREVQIASDGAVLAGTLLLPAGPGPHPAVVFAHGAGPHDRHGTFRLLGSHMARRGVAALVYDKRGIGDSTGSFSAATFDDLSADTLAGVDLLAGHPDIDPDRIGVAGFSQGAWVVADAAQRNDDIAFVVAMSPSGFTPADQQAWLHGSMLAARGFDRSAMVIADRVSRMQYSSLDLVDAGLMPSIPHVPGFWFHALDPYQETTGLWQAVRQPTLLIWGANDCQVPAHDSMTALGEALRRGGNAEVNMVILAGADHSLTLEGPCVMETTGHHDSHVYADGALTLGPDWVNGLPGRPAVDPIAGRSHADVLAWHLPVPEPAPWYGTLAAQLAVLILLLVLFGLVAGRWAVAGVRRRSVSLDGHVAGVAGLAGLAAVVIGVAAFTEIAMLGGVHAGPLVGPPQVAGVAPLMTLARILVAVTTGATLMVAWLRRRAATGGSRAARLLLPGSVLLLLWAGYWQLVPFAA